MTRLQREDNEQLFRDVENAAFKMVKAFNKTLRKYGLPASEHALRGLVCTYFATTTDENESPRETVERFETFVRNAREEFQKLVVRLHEDSTDDQP